LAVGVIVAVVAASVDLRGAIGFSSFGVLLYYAIANAAAWTLPDGRRGAARIIAALGLVGCLVLCASVPSGSLILGVVVAAVGAVIFLGQRLLTVGRP
jgi:APA family basic amino acid/polyamine antiporter